MAEPRRDNIKAIRISRGVKRPALAEQVGISYKHMWGIEEGDHTAAPETLNRIANALEVHVSQVMVEESASAKPTRTANPTSHPKPARPEPPPRESKPPTKTADVRAAS